MKMDNLMKQAQKMQKQMMEIQEELANRTVEASVGGGVVTVVANGQQDIYQSVLILKLLIQMMLRCFRTLY